MSGCVENLKIIQLFAQNICQAGFPQADVHSHGIALTAQGPTQGEMGTSDGCRASGCRAPLLLPPCTVSRGGFLFSQDLGCPTTVCPLMLVAGGGCGAWPRPPMAVPPVGPGVGPAPAGLPGGRSRWVSKEPCLYVVVSLLAAGVICLWK